MKWLQQIYEYFFPQDEVQIESVASAPVGTCPVCNEQVDPENARWQGFELKNDDGGIDKWLIFHHSCYMDMLSYMGKRYGKTLTKTDR